MPTRLSRSPLSAIAKGENGIDLHGAFGYALAFFFEASISPWEAQP